MYNSVVCSTFNVKCSWDGLPEGRNCSCVWSLWCSELCSVDQTVTVQRGCVVDVRGLEWFFQPFFLLWINTDLGEWGGLYQWFAQQSGLPSVVRSDLVAELNQTVIDVQRTDSMMATVSAAPVAGWTTSAGEGSTTSAGPFSQWTQFYCPNSGPEKLWCPGIWMTPLQPPRPIHITMSQIKINYMDCCPLCREWLNSLTNILLIMFNTYI